jgi:hypothetical protein
VLHYIRTVIEIIVGFVSTCLVMAACNLVAQKQVYEYLIQLQYFPTTK